MGILFQSENFLFNSNRKNLIHNQQYFFLNLLRVKHLWGKLFGIREQTNVDDIQLQFTQNWL